MDLQIAATNLRRAIYFAKTAIPPECATPVGVKTIADVEAQARKILGRGSVVSYKGVDLDFANSINAKFIELKQRFGLRVKKIFQKTDWTDHTGNLIQGQYLPKTKVIVLNADMVSSNGIKQLAKDLATDFKAGFRASPKTIDLITHEYGHAVFDALPKAKQNMVRDWIMDSGFERRISKEISRYADKNVMEFFAESFVRVANGSAPQEVISLYKKIGVLK